MPSAIEPIAQGIETKQDSTRWFAAGFWAVCDQALFAGTNFLVNVLLARRLSSDAYGAFTIAFATFLFVATFHTAMFTEPMLVFGPGRYKARLPEYFGSLMFGHLGAAGIGAIILAGVGLVCQAAGSQALGKVFWALACAQPFILFLWLMRRACYIRSETRTAAAGGAMYLVVVLLGVLGLSQKALLTPASALSLMGVASLAVGVWFAVKLGTRRPRAHEMAFVTDAARQHWTYGRWAMATAIVGFIPGNIYYFLLPLFSSLAESGALRAMLNLVMPFLQLNTALCSLLLPNLVRARGTLGLARTVRLALLLLAGVPAVAWIVLGIAAPYVVHVVYGQRFQEYSGYLWIVGLVPVTSGLTSVLGLVLRAHERPDLEFTAGCWTMLATGVGVLIMFKNGVLGAGIGMVLGGVVRTVVLLILSRRLLGRHGPADSGGEPESTCVTAGISGS
jgi:O-antigen/teichoic acid export membrane protein